MWLLLYQNSNSAFLASIALGVLIGLVYDVFRIIRVIYKGGRLKLFFEDVLFCVMASLVFAVFLFNASMGVLRMFAAFGVILGFFAYRFSVGRFTVPLAKRLKMWLVFPIKKAASYCSLRLSVYRDRRYTHADTKRIRGFAKKGFR